MTDPGTPIGVLALQGDFECHRRRLQQLGACVGLVRTASDLEQVGALVIPGGESTAMLKLAGTDLFRQLHRFVRKHPTLGTCAGAILLARAVDPWQPSLDAIDITIKRNAYGRQVDSSIRTGLLGTSPVELVFIRAPRIVGVGMDVDVLAREHHDPVLVRERHVMAATFHPELGEDTRVLQMFLALVAQCAGGEPAAGNGRPRADPRNPRRHARLTGTMLRRKFLEVACAWAASPGMVFGQHGSATLGGAAAAPADAQTAGPADLQLRIAAVSLELAPKRTIRTLAYNGQVPGPLVRARAGRPFTVDVVNDTEAQDIVHWHGFHIPSEVDGSIEEGTPAVAPRGGRQRYTFTADPPGTRWYHSHAVAGRDLKKSTYSGQFGLFIVESGDERGAYDMEVPILLHEWEPRFNEMGDVAFRYFSINGKMLGAGEPVRVRESQRVLFRIVNASATLQHRLALPGHVFEVTALDGNPVPTPKRVQVLDLAPGERVDALVEMNRPGVWTFGALRRDWREAGMGIVVEYAGHQGPADWRDPGNAVWDYGEFGGPAGSREPDGRLSMIFRPVGDGHRWTINDRSYPRTTPIVVQANKRYRWVLDNQSAENHPVHLHRHTFEVVKVDGRTMSGIMKDVVVVPAWKQVEIDVTADHPGLSLFHCHQQFHMDMGFMAMMQYG